MTPYDDIIHLPHPEPKRHRRMARADRAAQFAPFAALTGFGTTLDAAAQSHLDAFAPDFEDFDD